MVNWSLVVVLNNQTSKERITLQRYSALTMFFSSQDRYGGTALTEEEQHQVKEEFDFEGNNAMFDKVVQTRT